MLILDIRQFRVLFTLLIIFACSVQAKVYNRCDLALELHFTHDIPLNQVATWVCIAQRESLFNTAAVGRLNSDGSADHGLFQISDNFWCSHNDDDFKTCGLLCSDLLDNDIANDVACIKQIHEEHKQLTGDGFNAWSAYQPFCRNQDYKQIASCFEGKQPDQQRRPQGSLNSIHDTNQLHKKYQHNPFLKNVPIQKAQPSTQPQGHASSPEVQYVQPDFTTAIKGQNVHTVNGATSNRLEANPFLKLAHPQKTQTQSPRHNDIPGTVPFKHNAVHSLKGKIYTRCSLAQELNRKHSFSLQDVATWVCIAEHQSSLNTAAVGRQNGDDSANYGLFQISNRYWCSDDEADDEGKACKVTCNKLMDDDLTDDVRCIRIIYDEHTRISGDGFNAWTVYQSRCQNQNIEHIRQCFDDKDLNGIQSTSNEIAPAKDKGKIYQSCELAQELYQKHNIPLEQVATWVCIAQHESNYKTAVVGRLNTDGSADHGLFQISDLYWCTHDRYGGKACNIPCDRLLDSDITDDVLCIKIIYEEHTRISGDGFNAWTVYQPHCRNKGLDNVKQCFTEKELKEYGTKPISLPSSNPKTSHTSPASKKGKIYGKCELAKELYHKHQMPMEQIPTWVCIAQHESSYNTAAVGRLNTDGSADHGLFQISDLFWCTHDQYGGKACNIPCDKLLDSDISDDVKCIKFIHNEHTRISGDGFTAWTVYNPHCRNKGMDHVKQCFSEKELKEYESKSIYSPSSNSITPHTPVSTKKGKIYSKCELAKELYHKHQMPMEQIPTWVCIAQHESSYNTAAVGRLNTDGSADHGLFQISDLFWCTHDQYGGKACNIPCDKLLDSDISDDVKCIKFIHNEHTRISGDGFTAWTVYNPHCRNKGMDHVKQCFSEKELKEYESKSIYSPSSNSITPHTPVSTKKGKIYSKCELAKELYHKHQMPMEQIPTWVCIAQHESSYNTAAVGRLNTDGSADHGLFQISDLFWCTHDQYGGKACNIPCEKLLDSDISDDVKCIKFIHNEHTRISGDGFTAWTVYNPHCRNKGMGHVKQCFSEKEFKEYETNSVYSPPSNSITPHTPVSTKKGKIYDKCELAKELYHKHQMPMEQIPTWVCIAQHESSYNTAAVGRLNTDGSADHGLFQISDLFWCTHDQYGGKACNIPCEKLLDSDISDDVKCIKFIHNEHTRISGDGFTAWTVYNPHCRNKGMDHVKQCFSEKELKEFHTKTIPPISPNAIQPAAAAKPSKGKIYKKCELAQELLVRHQMPMEQIPTWVCIAQHESSYNTAAVGRLNTDGSADHGLFQISDLFWCTHDQYGGKACNLPCAKLLDADIADDVRCIKIIYEEHTQLSGDGFNAWTVYKPHCRNRQLQEIRDCFNNNEVELYEKNKLNNVIPEIKTPNDYSHNPLSSGIQKTTTSKDNKSSISKYANNPFLQNANIILTTNPQVEVKVPTVTDSSSFSPGNYKSNPFLNGAIKTTSVLENSKPYTPNTKNYKNNPFLNGSIKISVVGEHSQNAAKPNYDKNPFLSGFTKSSSATTAIPANHNQSPYLSRVVPVTTSLNHKQTKITPTVPTVFHQSNPFLENKSQTSSKYLDSNSFRTKTTTGAKSTTTTKYPKPAVPTTTTSKPRVTIPTITNYKTTTSSTTSQKQTTPGIRRTTAKPFTTSRTTQATKTITTKRPTTLRNWETEKLKQTSTPTPTKTPTTKFQTTSKKPTFALSTSTTRKLTTAKTTKHPTTVWRWNDHKTKQTTTTKKTTTFPTPKSTTSRTATTKTAKNSTPTTKSAKTITTWSWDNEKLKQKTSTTTKKPTTSRTTPKTSTTFWTTSRKPKTTPKPITTPTSRSLQDSLPKASAITTTRSLYNGQQYKQTPSTTTRIPTTTIKPTTRKTTTHLAITTKPHISTTKAITSWNWNNSKQQQSSSTTTRMPLTTSARTKATKSSTIFITTTKKPLVTQRLTTKTTKLPLVALNYAGQQQKHSGTATKTTSTRKSSQLQISTTNLPKSQTTTTKRPKTTTTWHWQQPIYANSTAITKITTKHTTTSWKGKLTTPRSTTYTEHQHLTTTTKRPKPTTTRHWQQPIYANSTAITKTKTKHKTTSLKSSSTTRKPPTTTLSWISGRQTATPTSLPSIPRTAWLGNNNKKTTTTKTPATKTLTTTKAATTIKTAKLTATNSVGLIRTTKPTNAQYKTTSAITKNPLMAGNYKKDPFSHPFFDRVRHQFDH